MGTVTSSVESVRNLKDGQWWDCDAENWSDVYNPSTGSIIARVPLCNPDDVDKVVQSAKRCTLRLERNTDCRTCSVDVQTARAGPGEL